ncbi:MAG TPA: PhoPQ-activated protein PqaA family protein [Candidatus Tectomicrobia bacterium]|nr:PhoPQ-activated protein PqaA family protein [Candidatus Tectomicrobia bacterium]
MTLFTATHVLTALTIVLACVPVAADELRRYVTADDPAYRWEHIAQMSPQEGIVVHELRLISQVWQGVTWQHRLRIITPEASKDASSLALLLVTGMGTAEQEWRDAVFMARGLTTPVALLSDVPNQPLFGELVEDDLLAHTFVKFLTTQDATWPLLLPMVKSVVRAMDAIQDFLQRQRPMPIAGFVVSGASKRGWTAWLTPVVDTRVKAIAPWVYDNLNLAQQLRHQRETWGHFSGQIAEYTERGLPQRLLAGEPGAVALAAIVDPFSYRHHLTVPKLIILATNDRYWPLDALNLYYDALPGERYVLYVANTGHTLQPGRERAIAGLMALFQHAAGRRQLPTLQWDAKVEGDTLSLTLTADRPPRSVQAWVATARTRDFRDARWEAFAMQTEHHRYVHRRPMRRGHITAIFGEAEYSANPGPFFLSTTVRLFP